MVSYFQRVFSTAEKALCGYGHRFFEPTSIIGFFELVEGKDALIFTKNTKEA